MKLERHSKIVELIGKYEIETQEELAEHLKEEGYQVTQATISRDIRELFRDFRVDETYRAFNNKYNPHREPCSARVLEEILG